MAKRIMMMVAAAGILFTACRSNPGMNDSTNSKLETSVAATLTDVPFRLAENYFVKNTVKRLDNPKIETAEQFNAVFGMARTMSEDSKPTAIDFSKEFVLAVILPETDIETSITDVSLQKNEKGELLLHYRVVSGAKQTFTTVPQLALILDKAGNDSSPLSITEQREQ